MQNSFFHRLSRLLWVGIVLLMVSLALLVSLGRLLSANLGAYQDDVLRVLNQRVPFVIEARQVKGEWRSFTPTLVLTDLRLSVPDSSEPPLVLSEGRFGIDVLSSLLGWSLQLNQLALSDLTLRGELSGDGQFSLTGFVGGGGEIGDSLEQLILNVERVLLQNNLLKLTLPGGEVRDLDLDLILLRDGSRRRLQADLLSTRGTRITVIGDGLGNPFRPGDFAGEMYVDIQSSDLGAVRGMFVENPPPQWAEGKLDVELWLSWNKGDPTIEGRFEATELLLFAEGTDKQVALDRLSFDARLLERKNRWTVFASELAVVADATVLVLPRLQFDVWGTALRLRAAEVPLAPVHALTSQLKLLPDTLTAVFDQLAPSGELSALQLSVGDISQPASDWEVEVNFRDLAVNSYKGAPGVRSADGFAQVSPDGGNVIIDSDNISLAFPGIYRQPLEFDELYGSLELGWHAESFWISSGLLRAWGEEGRAHALFGLDVPLVPSGPGVEMELLVGLENTSPEHRNKYLPYTLNANLLSWLSESIGEGTIERGAFLWRGSLKPENSAQRTVQLAFNIADTDFSYHPQWPPVQVDKGVVFINDAAVSVWSELGHLYESEVRDLSVETRLAGDGDVLLAVDGKISGPAADGLRIVNDSPLADIVGATFSQWQADGLLDSQLRLRMNLTDKQTSPDVEVATQWHDVDLVIAPGNISVEAFNAELGYSTESGFNAGELSARLWGQPVDGKLVQAHPSAKYEAKSSVLDILLASQADMEDVRNWLQLHQLNLASGKAKADISLRIAPGAAPTLLVESDLQGVALDLPRPWNKRKQEAVPLRVELPLGADDSPLQISLGGQLFLSMDIQEGSFMGGSLGINTGAPPIQRGQFQVSGSAALLQGDEWIDFVSRYILPPTPEAEQAEPAPDSDPGQQVPLAVLVSGLKADELILLDRYIQDVTMDLIFQAHRWDINLDAGWFAGELSLARDEGESTLRVSHLDLDQLAQLSGPAGGAGENGGTAPDSQVEIPPMDVTVDNLYQSERRLGNLAFSLQSEFGVLTADMVTGELAGSRLTEEQPGHLVWHQGQDGGTELRAHVSFTDVGQTLAYFGYEQIVKTKQGVLTFDMHWPGAPQDFSLATARGDLRINMSEGSFLEAPSGAAGALRVVSILNLADIVRRLSLTHMFESGIPFESVEGEVYLHAGTIEVPKLDVRGSSSFQFSGVSDVGGKTLNGELVATLPVAKNLPWIAALAASLPVAAGVFVVSKVFDKQMHRLSSAVYRIDGTWDEPEVNFDRIFDDSSAQPDLTGPKQAAEPAPDQP